MVELVSFLVFCLCSSLSAIGMIKYNYEYRYMTNLSSLSIYLNDIHKIQLKSKYKSKQQILELD